MILPAHILGRVAAVGLVPAALFGLALPAHAEVTFEQITSPSGIEAWFVEDHTVPIVTLSFAFKGGAAQDPDDKLGRANLMTTLLDEGAGDLDSDAFQTRQEEVGLEMGFNANQDEFSGFARMLADQREEATELIALAVNEPRFDQPAIDRMRAQITASIVSRSQDPNRIASLMWNAELFGDHPYGRPAEGTEETLPGITGEDLDAFHDAVFATDTLKIGIVGALDAETAGEMIDAIFGDLPDTGDLVPVPPTDVSYGEELAVNHALPQTRLNLAFPGVAEADPDFFPAYVLTEILAGGSLQSQLNIEVREKRGLSYGVSGGLVSLDEANLLTIGTATAPDTAGEVLDIIDTTLQRMVTDGPDEAQLERIKRYLIGAYPISQLRSSVAITSAMVSQQLRGLPIDYVTERVGLIEAVTAEQVQAVAEKIFSSEPSLMLVGPGAEEEAPAAAE